MIKIVMFQSGDGLSLPVFLGDTETQYYGKDILRTPGVYSEETNGRFGLMLAKLQGTVGTYATAGMFLLYDMNEGFENLEVEDATSSLLQYLTVPETAAKMLLKNEDEDKQEFIEKALETLHYYETLTENSKVFLPEESFKYMSDDVSAKMRSVRHVYVLNAVDNMEIVQADCTSNFGIVLADVESIHTGDAKAAALDTLRVLAPYRRDVNGAMFQYNGIYHTPYYKVDQRLRGAVPSYLGFINGYTKNDTLEVQTHERHMYDNLYTLVCSDIARYTVEIMTGILFQCSFGQKLRRMVECKDSELLQQLATDAASACPPDVEYGFNYSEVQSLTSGEWTHSDVAAALKNSIKFSREAIDQLLDALPVDCQVIDTEHLPFVLEIPDADVEYFTEKLISRGVITYPMMEYLVSLCTASYRVNWGHTGATKAIQRFVTMPSIKNMDTVIAAHLASAIGKAPMDPNINIRLLYASQSVTEEEQDLDNPEVLDGDDSDEDANIFSQFEYYITSSTVQKISNGSLPSNYFTTKATGAESVESSIVEYWRTVDGEQGLYYFLRGAYMVTGDFHVLIESFLKLSRWGSIKPSMLVLEKYPSVKTVFDLNTGKEVKNTAIVDESQLQTVKGCKYSLKGFLTAMDIIGTDKSSIVGFVLLKDYGEIKKRVLASFIDIGEMVVQGAIDVAELKGVQNFIAEECTISITDYVDVQHEIYTSERNIQEGLKHNIRPAALSELSLLFTPGVLRSVEYLKAKHAQMVVTTKDRQYQILNAYVKTMQYVYNEFPVLLESKEPISTTAIISSASLAYETFNKYMQGQAPDVNTVRATQAVGAMNLDIDSQTSKPSLHFDQSPLEGKFTIIVDEEMASGLPSMTFTDATVQNLANRCKNRVVMLMLIQGDKLLFCRKDIKTSEVLLTGGVVKPSKYGTVAPIMDRLLKGQNPPVRNASTNTVTKAMLHETLREFYGK